MRPESFILRVLRLRRLALKGWLLRLKHGVYTIVPITSTIATPAIENAWLLAMDLFYPAFISGWSAAEHWNLTEQIFNSISVSTMTPQRESIQLFGNVKFRTKLLNKEQFFGTKKIWFGSNVVEIADPSRMLIDILDLPRFGGGGRHMVVLSGNIGIQMYLTRIYFWNMLCGINVELYLSDLDF